MPVELTIVEPAGHVLTVVESGPSLTVGAGGVVLEAATAPGPPGPPGSSFEAFVHVQSSPLATWVIDHGLGAYPAVTLIVDGVEVEADVVYGSLNQTSIIFPAPTAGTARLI